MSFCGHAGSLRIRAKLGGSGAGCDRDDLAKDCRRSRPAGTSASQRAHGVWRCVCPRRGWAFLRRDLHRVACLIMLAVRSHVPLRLRSCQYWRQAAWRIRELPVAFRLRVLLHDTVSRVPQAIALKQSAETWLESHRNEIENIVPTATGEPCFYTGARGLYCRDRNGLFKPFRFRNRASVAAGH